MWGQPYGSPVEAWVAAPFFAAFGATPTTLRAVYFLLGLVLIPAAWALGRALDPRAALPAAALAACPSPYLLLMAAAPPPMYPAALLLSAPASPSPSPPPGAAGPSLLAARRLGRSPPASPCGRTS